MKRITPSLSPSGDFASSSSFDGPIHALAPIIPLRQASETEASSINDISSVLSERDVDHLYDTSQIPWETFHVFAPSPYVHVNDLIPTEDAIMVFVEQLKAGLWFPMDPFFMDVLWFHKLSLVQLHPNS